MRKRFFFLLSGLFALFLLYKLNTYFQNFVLLFFNGIKKEYRMIQNSIEERIELHFQQAKTIQQLQKENIELSRYQFLVKDLQDRLQNLLTECNQTLPFQYHLRYIQAISYVDFANYTALWLDTKLKEGGIAGLIYKGSVAGIAIGGERTKALLNGNKKCSYGVIIAGHANGVAVGSGDNRYIIVKYIPNYEHIKPGDRVETNGLDHIFGYGIGVGIVVKVWQEGSYKVAKVKTFASLEHPRFFWLMEL